MSKLIVKNISPLRVVIKNTSPLRIKVTNNNAPKIVVSTRGVQGIRGKSAYEVAVFNGFVGTEAEWLVFLEGSGGVWGSITGTLADQLDLQAALDALDITASNGLTTSGTDIKLGGALTEDTTINLAERELKLSSDETIAGVRQQQTLWVTAGGSSDPAYNELFSSSVVTLANGDYVVAFIDSFASRGANPLATGTNYGASSQIGTIYHSGFLAATPNSVLLSHEHYDSVGSIDNISSLLLTADASGAVAALTGDLAIAGDVQATNLSGTNTGDETAAGILAKLLTVDGPGSGLDADTLDGISSAGFDAAGAAAAAQAAAASDATTKANAAQAAAVQRANHTGTQLANTISDFAATVRTTVLTGLSLVTNQAIAATDTVLQAFGYLQKQITDLIATVATKVASASNGLTKTGSDIKLGGTLTQDTAIDVGAYELKWAFDVTLAGTRHQGVSWFTDGSASDSAYNEFYQRVERTNAGGDFAYAQADGYAARSGSPVSAGWDVTVGHQIGTVTKSDFIGAWFGGCLFYSEYTDSATPANNHVATFTVTADASGRYLTGVGFITTDNLSGTNTGDETAAGILAKLLTVDGPGSGLDADTLDGISSAGFDAAGAAAAAQTAAQSYADTLVVGLVDDRGNYNASGNVFPSSGGSGPAGAVKKGDLWTVSVAGTIGGHVVTAGDLVRALVDTPGQTDANWAITENNLGYVAENSANKVTSMSGASTNTQYPSAKATYDADVAVQAAAATDATTKANAAQAAAVQRSNHTGMQLASTISDFTEAAQDAIGGAFDSTLVYNDASNAIGRAAITGDVTIAAGSNTSVVDTNYLTFGEILASEYNWAIP